ncbi:MAG: phosphoribosylglycinamide formyltransferase [Syntrophobacteraceae bacterium]
MDLGPRARKLRLAVLISGGGTNLQAMIDRCAAGSLNACIEVVVSDQAGAFGLKRAERADIPAFHISYKMCAESALQKAQSLVDLADLDRRQKILKMSDPRERIAKLARLVVAESELIRTIESFKPDYVCLAGFMRLLTPYFINYFNVSGPKIINIHPALLPSFPGSHGYEDTFNYGCKWGGISVHFVDQGEDTGPLIAQAVYPLWPGEDIEKIRNRGLSLEYEVYSQVINWLAAGHVLLKSSPDGRPRIEIADPDYPSILAAWVEKALSCS